MYQSQRVIDFPDVKPHRGTEEGASLAPKSYKCKAHPTIEMRTVLRYYFYSYILKMTKKVFLYIKLYRNFNDILYRPSILRYVKHLRDFRDFIFETLYLDEIMLSILSLLKWLMHNARPLEKDKTVGLSFGGPWLILPKKIFLCPMLLCR